TPAAQCLLDQPGPTTYAEQPRLLGLPGEDRGLDDVDVGDLTQPGPGLAQPALAGGLVGLDVEHGEAGQHHGVLAQRGVGPEVGRALVEQPVTGRALPVWSVGGPDLTGPAGRGDEHAAIVGRTGVRVNRARRSGPPPRPDAGHAARPRRAPTTPPGRSAAPSSTAPAFRRPPPGRPAAASAPARPAGTRAGRPARSHARRSRPAIPRGTAPAPRSPAPSRRRRPPGRYRSPRAAAPVRRTGGSAPTPRPGRGGRGPPPRRAPR